MLAFLFQTPPDLGLSSPLSAGTGRGRSCSASVPCVPTSFLPSSWTDDPLKKTTNNCYNYATNTVSNTFPRPGGSTTALTGEGIRDGCESEGMEDFSDPVAGSFPDTPSCVLALVVMENLDFHFYRLDGDNKWSHKLGAHVPTNLDNDGVEITDPRTANIGPYQFARFIGFCDRKFNGFT